MVLGSEFIPRIEGFQPIPNAVMVPFMELQSAALAFAFGLNYEFGKRTLGAMSNETFNSLTPEDISRLTAEHTTVLIKEFIEQVPKVLPAQDAIFKMYFEIETKKVLQNVELAKWIAINAPSILLTGTSTETDIKTSSEVLPPATTSSDATSISQDASGTVTTTTSKPAVPNNQEGWNWAQINSTTTTTRLTYEQLGQNLDRQYVKNIDALFVKSRETLALAQSGNYSVSTQANALVLIIEKEINQQRQWLWNVLTGYVPY